MNKHEINRADISNKLREVCVTESATATAYNWSIGRAYSKIMQLFPALCLDGKLDSDAKSLVTFEFNKLKDAVMSQHNWKALRSREGYVLTPDSIEKRRVDTFGLKAISLEEQLKGGRMLLDATTKSLSNTNNQETADRLRRRQRKLLKEINQLTIEIQAQKELQSTPSVLELAPA